MILCIPAHSSTPQIEKLAADLKRKGAYNEHVLRIISTREDEELSYQIGDALSDSFRKVTTETLPPLSERFFKLPLPVQHTFLANAMFKKALAFLEGYKYEPDEVQDAPMLYFDPRYRPVQQGWLNELQSEFFLKNSPPVMGRTQTLNLREDRNVKVEDPKRVTVGPLIFGRKCIGQMPLLGFLDEKEHWRSKMRHELVSDFVETKAIGAGSKSLLKEMQPAKIGA